LGTETVWCRSSLADFGVLYDTYRGRYHLPPDDLRPVGSILDLGSNIGLTMAHFAVLFPEARILGVEPAAANAELAAMNTKVFGSRCAVLRAAVWHEPGELAFGGDRESGYAVITGKGKAARFTASAVTMDELMARMGGGQVDFVKMDIEGAEREVFKNAGRWPQRVRCLKVEVHPEKASRLYPIGECLADLERLGFSCTLDRAHHASIIARR
jgi:FkbM family methyltransferase